MPELTDDQLDGLFRKSAEEFDPPFDPAAWQDMASRLDTHDQIRPAGVPMWKSLLRWGLPALLLLLLTGGGWYAYRKTYAVVNRPTKQVVSSTNSPLNQKSEQPQRYVASRLPDSKPAQTTSADSPESGAGLEKQPADLTKPVAESSKLENSVVESGKLENRVAKFSEPENRIAESNKLKNRIATATRLNTNTASRTADATKRLKTAYGLKTKRDRTIHSQLTTAVSAPTEAIAAIGYNSARKRTRKETPQRRKLSKTASNRTDDALLVTNSTVPTTSAVTNKRGTNKAESVQVGTTATSGNVTALESSESGPVFLTDVHELAARPGKWTKSTFANPDVVAQPETLTRSAAPKSATQTQRGLSVRLVVAPDLSTIGLKDFSRPGTNFGVMLEYRLASRWSVQAGVIQSTKVYRAQASEYSFPWMWPVDPTSIDGKCNMLDIPINVRYDFAVRPRQDGRLPSRWFVSGGVTSYIMKQEEYVYNYSGYVHNPPSPYSGKSGNYGFSQLNFSVGYERAFSKRLSWQVEPFIKAPLRGVGFFGVNLLSTGAFFSIRYKLSNH